MRLGANIIVALITVGTVMVSTIVAFANLFDRSARAVTVLEDHESRLDKIERDETVKDKLGKLQESVNYLNWQVEAIKKEADRKKR